MYYLDVNGMTGTLRLFVTRFDVTGGFNEWLGARQVALGGRVYAHSQARKRSIMWNVTTKY